MGKLFHSLNVILECIYLIHLLGISHRLVSGQTVRLVGNGETFKGKVELWARWCNLFHCDNDWFAICYDGSDDPGHPTWNREAATVACRQLGYEGGWEGSQQGVTTEYSLEGFECSTESDSSLNECIHDDYEHCGCSRLYLYRCADHEQQQEQAFVECYNFSDISLHFEEMNGGVPNEGKLKVLYRGDLYDVCYQGNDTDDNIWSMDEANVACRHLGYQLGAVRTGRLDGGSDLPKSFDDFTCNKGMDNIFSCFPDPPNESGCGANNTVFLECQASSPSSVPTVPSSPTTVATTTDFQKVTHTSQYNITQIGDTLAQTSSNDTGLIVGTTLGILAVFIALLAVVIYFMIYRRKDNTSPQLDHEYATTHPNATFQNEYNDSHNENTEYAYAYADVRSNRNSTQTSSNANPVDNQRHEEEEEGWADNVAYVTHNDEELTNHNTDGGVISQSNLARENQTGEDEGWSENVAYVSHDNHDDEI